MKDCMALLRNLCYDSAIYMLARCSRQWTVRVDEHLGVSLDTLVELVVCLDGLIDTALVRDDERWLGLARDLDTRLVLLSS
jgi:hypothetical protein